MLWQSSLLIAVLFVLDFALRRKLRASVRYALWLVLLVKLLLPPSLALPSGLGWWLRHSPPTQAKPRVTFPAVTHAFAATPNLNAQPPSVLEPPPSGVSVAAMGVFVWSAVSLGLLAWMLARCRQVGRIARRATAAPPWLGEPLTLAQRQAGLRGSVRLRLTDRAMPPAACGLFRPMILLPRSLAEQLAPAQLQAVLLHELIHLRRGDLWVNFVQTLLQIAYWWHPLLWLANARVRRMREEAVDDAVMVALSEDAQIYPSTLLEVAKAAFGRPLAALRLVGILESRTALRGRIERLLNFGAPRKAGLTLVSVVGILAFAMVALPQGAARRKPAKPSADRDQVDEGTKGRKTKASATNSPMWEFNSIMATGSMQYDLATGLASGTSGVVVKYGKAVLIADRVTLNRQTGDVTADGNVRVQSDGQSWEGDHLRSNLKSSVAERNTAPGPGDSIEPEPDGPTPPKTGLLPETNPPGHANLFHRSKGRQAILDKLQRLRLDNVLYDHVPLGEVLRSLNAEAKRRDPDKRNIVFIISPDQGFPEPVDISSVVITIKPPLANARLVDVLEAIVKVADKPIKYSVEDYAVVFSPSRLGEPLYTRSYHLDPRIYHPLLSEQAGLSESSTEDERVQALFKLLSDAGVNFPPSTMFLHDDGRMIFRATFQQLDLIEQVLLKLNGGTLHSGAPSLYTGLFKVDPNTFLAELQKRAGLNRALTPDEISAAVREFFVDAGVVLEPPKYVHFKDGESVLRALATEQELDRIEAAVQQFKAQEK